MKEQKLRLLTYLKNLESDGYWPSRQYTFNYSVEAMEDEIHTLLHKDKTNLMTAFRLCTGYIGAVLLLGAISLTVGYC